MQKKKYLIGLAVLVVFIIAYHFYAAHRAEEQISRAIREQVKAADTSLSVTWSAIDVSAFSGDIRWDHLAVIDSASMKRSRSVRINMDYRDFLNIYFRGLRYGLEHLDRAVITLEQPSYVDRSSLREFKFSSLDIICRGNMWDILVSLVNTTPLQTPQTIIMNGEQFAWHRPGALPGTVKAETYHSEHFLPAGSRSWRQSNHKLTATRLIWSPPSSFQEQYGFFIRGFGYETDHIPIDSLLFALKPTAASPRLLSVNLFTELFDAEAGSQLLINRHSFEDSRLVNGSIGITNTSEQFETFLKNLERLLGRNIYEGPDTRLRFSGPVDSLRLSIGQ